jgi:hypothetical protein
MTPEEVSKDGAAALFGHLEDASMRIVEVLDSWHAKIELLNSRRVHSLDATQIHDLGIEIDAYEACYRDLDEVHRKLSLAITQVTEC